METALIKCPNCGANATNHTNCEYCGSLLVRFAAAGVDLSKTTYTNDSATFPRFADELRKNLQLQEGTSESVVTDVYSVDSGNKSAFISCILRSGKALWSDYTNITLSHSDEGLIIAFLFYEKDPDLKRFRELDSYQLFTEHATLLNGQKCYEYAIDFGKDADGAARLISEIYEKVYRITNMRLSYHTNVGCDAIDNDRNAMGIGGIVSEGEGEGEDRNWFWWMIFFGALWFFGACLLL